MSGSKEIGSNIIERQLMLHLRVMKKIIVVLYGNEEINYASYDISIRINILAASNE